MRAAATISDDGACRCGAAASEDDAGSGEDERDADGDACIDEDVKADLFAKRKQRTSRDRLFQQTNRHELTAAGRLLLVRSVRRHLHRPAAKYLREVPLPGTFGFAYAYHMTEDLGGRGLGGLHAADLRGRARAGARLRRPRGESPAAS